MTQTVHSLIERRALKMRCSRAAKNPSMPSADMTHWRCTIRNDAGARIQTVFSMGSGHGQRQPELAEVLDCLCSDAASAINAADFADWCSELGYDTDSRRAFGAFNACRKTADKLRRLLGADFDGALFDTERL